MGYSYVKFKNKIKFKKKKKKKKKWGYEQRGVEREEDLGLSAWASNEVPPHIGKNGHRQKIYKQ